MKKITKYLVGTISFLTLFSSLVGCGGKTEVKVETLSISGDRNVIGVGSTLQLTATYSPTNATNAQFSYSSENNGVATVTEAGLVKALKEGSTNIVCTLKDNSKSAKFAITVDPLKDLSVDDFANALASTPYATKGIAGERDFGLADAENVGVIQENIKDVAPLKTESEYDLVIKYENIDQAKVEEYFPKGTPLSDFVVLDTMFKIASDESDGTKSILVKLPNRVMEIPSSLYKTAKTFYLEELKNVTILGEEDTEILLVAENLDWKGYFTFQDCENVIFKNVKLDAKYPSTMTGELTSIDVDNSTATVKIDPYFNDLAKELMKVEQGGHKKVLYEYLEFGKQSKAPVPFGNCFDQGSFNDYTLTGNDTDGYTMVVEFAKTINQSRLFCNVILSFTEYGQYDANETSAGMNISYGHDIYLEDVNMYHASGMGLVGTEVENFFVNKFNVMLRENSKNLMTVTADAMHFDKCRGKVEVTNCIIENSHDDALNMKHGYWYKLNSVVASEKKIVCTRMTGYIEPIVGDKLAIYDENTFESHNPESGYYTITSITPSGNTYEIIVDRRLSNTAAWGSCRVTFVTRAPEFKFVNNIVRNKRNRGILVQVPDAIVQNNTFENIGHGSIQAACAMDIYNECTIPQNLTIKDNKFISNISLTTQPGYGDINVFCLSNQPAVAPKGTLYGTVIENNFFTDNGNAAVALRGTGETNINDNFFYECCSRQISGEMYNAILYASNSSDVVLDGNYNHYKLDMGMSGVILADLTTKADVNIMESNTNIKFYQAEKSGEKVDVERATGNITFDGDLSEWDSIGATDIALIGCSDAKSEEHTFSEIEDHFKVNKAKIASTADGIAFAFDVYDNEFDFKTVNDFWTGDCIEIFFSDVLDLPTADMKNYKDTGAVAQIAFAPTWTSSNYAKIAADRTNSSYIRKEAQLQVAFVKGTDGYTVEILLPYSLFPELKNSIDAGNRIAISTIIADSSRKIGEKCAKDYERIQVGNVPHFVENYKLKTEMMPLYLFK